MSTKKLSFYLTDASFTLDLTGPNQPEMEGHIYYHAIFEPLQDINISNKHTPKPFQNVISIETGNHDNAVVDQTKNNEIHLSLS